VHRDIDDKKAHDEIQKLTDAVHGEARPAARAKEKRSWKSCRGAGRLFDGRALCAEGCKRRHQGPRQPGNENSNLRPLRLTSRKCRQRISLLYLRHKHRAE